MANATTRTTRASRKGQPTRSRSEHADAVRRANRVAMLQWWAVGTVLIIGIVLMVLFFSGDGSGVPTDGGPVGPIGHG